MFDDLINKLKNEKFYSLLSNKDKNKLLKYIDKAYDIGHDDGYSKYDNEINDIDWTELDDEFCEMYDHSEDAEIWKN